ncbi:MAG: hypothetical protein KTR31_33345 [Myxococcales bacterium]|nr:hypothetical protein [Myxococcales bacterium]
MTTIASMMGLLWVGTASAESPLRAEHFSVTLPVEVDLVGLASGLHPELTWRPFRSDGAFHVRVATGLMAGPELALVPLSFGLREVLFPRQRVRPTLGLGIQMQTFLPYGHAPKVRLDQYMELGVDVRVREGWRIAFQASPEFGWLGGFGLGMAARLGVTADLPLRL